MTSGMTPSQERAYSAILSGYNVFLTGYAGTGKSYVLRKAIDGLTAAGKNVVVAAPTGIAAINVGGTTIHRLFNLKPDIYAGRTPRVPPVLKKKTDVLFIDEISMCRIDLFDYVGRVLQKTHPIQVVVVGDFCQLPPVIRGGDGYDEKNILDQHFGFDVGGGYAFLSPQWKRLNFRPIVLEEVIRQEDPHFVEALNRARMGDTWALQYFAEHANRAVIHDGIYLAGRNAEVDQINAVKLRSLPAPSFFYEAEGKGEVTAEDRKVAPERLELKVGARIMTTMNDPNGDYYNGSTGTIASLDDHCVVAQMDDGITCEILKNTWEIIRYEVDESKPEISDFKRTVVGKYTQYPIKLAWAVTIHKSQGQTFSKVNLNPSCWDSGQLYVALSRVRSVEGLHFTRPLYDKYLFLDPVIAEFYRNLEDGMPYDAGVAHDAGKKKTSKAMSVEHNSDSYVQNSLF